MPPGVRFLPDPANADEPNYDVDAPVDFWVSCTPDETQPRARGWNTVARLRDGATLEQAQTELAALASRQGTTDPDLRGLTAGGTAGGRSTEPRRRGPAAAAVRVVALVFFVASVNVAGLFVARGLQRHREYAMRAALGASRLRLFRQLITESAALRWSVRRRRGLAIASVRLFKTIGGQAMPRADR